MTNLSPDYLAILMYWSQFCNRHISTGTLRFALKFFHSRGFFNSYLHQSAIFYSIISKSDKYMQPSGGFFTFHFVSIALTTEEYDYQIHQTSTQTNLTITCGVKHFRPKSQNHFRVRKCTAVHLWRCPVELTKLLMSFANVCMCTFWLVIDSLNIWHVIIIIIIILSFI